MKIAKKLLAAVVAVMLVCTLAVSAFAAVSASADVDVSLETTWENEDGYVVVDVYLDKAVGATSWKLDLKFDPAVLEYEYCEDGAAVAECKETKNNTIEGAIGDTNASEGILEIGGYMKLAMFTQDDFTADAKKNQDALVNPDHCHLWTLYFVIVDEAGYEAVETAMTIEGTVDFAGCNDKGFEYAAADTKTVADETAKTGAAEPTTAEPTTIDTQRPTEDKPIKPGEKPTGDSAALAAAAGVVLLAGAAFVVSKKRK